MKTHVPKELAPLFPELISVALSQLKTRLRDNYQKAYPDSGEIIHRLIDCEEARARELSFFPHLILPDLVEARFAELGLESAQASPDTTAASRVGRPRPSVFSAVARRAHLHQLRIETA